MAARRRRARAVTALACAGAFAAACAGGADEAEPPQHDYEAALLERVVQLADEALSRDGGEPPPYCVARRDSAGTTYRDPSAAVLEPADLSGRTVHPISACGSPERPTVDGERAVLVVLGPWDSAAPHTLRGGFVAGPGFARFYACPVAGAETGVQLGVCRIEEAS